MTEHDDHRPGPEGPADDELTPEARQAILRLLDEIQRLRDALAASNRRIAHLESIADEDPLTPAINRRAFLRELERAAAASERYRVPNSVVFIDIDGFKAVNDRFGHAAGEAQAAEKAAALAALLGGIGIERDGERVAIAATAGCFTMGPGTSAADALAAADRAMYANKARNGR